MTSGNAVVKTALVVICVILVVAALRASWFVTMPLTFAVFATVLAWPLQKRLRRSLPKWLSVVIVVALAACVLAAFFGALWLATSQLSSNGETIVIQLKDQAQQALNWAQARGVEVGEAIQPQALFDYAWTWIKAGIASLYSALAILGLILIYFILLVIEADQWPKKIRAGFDGEQASTMIDSTASIIQTVQRYLLVKLCIGLLSGGLVWVWCLVLQIDLALVWGLTTFLFNFVPNIGSIISYAFPTLTAFAQHDWKWALLTLGCIAATDLVVSNFLEPRLQGRTLHLSPVVVLLAVIFWGWIWGIGGMMLAVPITASLAIVALHVPRLNWLAHLLGEQAPQKNRASK